MTEASSFPCVQGSDVGRWGHAEVKMEGGDGDGSSQQHQWQINLLDHIDAVQEEVTHRMDFIERELDGEACPLFSVSK